MESTKQQDEDVKMNNSFESTASSDDAETQFSEEEIKRAEEFKSQGNEFFKSK